MPRFQNGEQPPQTRASQAKGERTVCPSSPTARRHRRRHRHRSQRANGRPWYHIQGRISNQSPRFKKQPSEEAAWPTSSGSRSWSSYVSRKPWPRDPCRRSRKSRRFRSGGTKRAAEHRRRRREGWLEQRTRTKPLPIDAEEKGEEEGRWRGHVLGAVDGAGGGRQAGGWHDLFRPRRRGLPGQGGESR